MTEIPGATNPVLFLVPVKVSDSGNYRFVVSNPRGETRSSVASLTLDRPSVALGNPIRLPDGRFSFSFPSQPGRLNVIQVSTDLQNWRTLTGVYSDGSEVAFIDPEAATGGLRFYRVVLSP